MARGDLYSDHPEWFRETISKTVVPYEYERQPQWASLDARRFVEEGIEVQKGWDSPEPSWKDEETTDYRLHPAGRYVGSTRVKADKSEFHAGHV